MGSKAGYIGIDQGSSSTKAVVSSDGGEILFLTARKVKTVESGGAVFQEPHQVLRSVRSALGEAVDFCLEKGLNIAGSGIATQRSSFLFFDEMGKPLTDLISWRDLSGSDIVNKLDPEGMVIRSSTGLPLTPYYSASKIRKYLPSSSKEVLFGTVNTFLIYNLTKNKTFSTDPGNAQRTLLYDIRKGSFSEELLGLFDVPGNVRFPAIRDTVDDYGVIEVGDCSFPLTASSGDQQAAFIASSGWETGRGLINVGTGGFLLVPVDEPPEDRGELILSLGQSVAGKVHYLLEGTVNAVSDASAYFEDIFGPFNPAGVISAGALPVVVFGLKGTGAPMWDQEFPVTVGGLRSSTTPMDITYSSILGSTCYFKIIDDYMSGKVTTPSELVISGGVSNLRGLAEFVRDLLDKRIYKADCPELTAVGVALMGEAFRRSGGVRMSRLEEVAGESPVPANRYFREWEKLYRLSRR